MKKIKISALVMGLIFGTFSFSRASHPVADEVGRSNISQHFSYNAGMMVKIWDGVKDQYTVYSGGVLDKIVQENIDGGFNVITDYHYERGSLVFSEVVGGNEDVIGTRTFYDGDQSRPLYTVNDAGTIVSEWEYSEEGFMSRNKTYDLIDGERELISETFYRDGLAIRTEGLKDPTKPQGALLEDGETNDMVVTQTFSYRGREMTEVVNKSWSMKYGEYDVRVTEDGDYEYWDGDEWIGITESDVTWAESETSTIYVGGRPDRVENNEGEVVRKYNYEGVKLASIDSMGDSGITEKVIFDQYGRQAQRVVYDYDDDGNLEERILKQEWVYNDSGETRQQTHVLEEDKINSVEDAINELYDGNADNIPAGVDIFMENGEVKMTVDVAPGGTMHTVEFGVGENEVNYTDTTYYANNRQITAIRDYDN